MKKVVSLVIVLLLIPAWGQVLAAKPTPEQTKAITATIMDYIEGWYEGNSERMDRALHPELSKKGLLVNPRTGRTFLNPIGKSAMVEATRAGVGKLAPEKRHIQVQIFDVHGDMASAVAMSAKFVDYIHLVHQDGRWMVANVLWVPNAAPDTAGK